MIASLLFAAAQAMTFTADRIAADSVTRALTATGHVVATSGPMTVRGDYMTRDADGTMVFHDPTCATTCSNAVGHTHWNVSGEVEYKDQSHVILRNAWLKFYEIPVFWLPYMYYPLNVRDCGFSWMPGYMGRWGGYLLTKYSYHLLGDPEHGSDSSWLRAATRFDLRYEQGIALGEDLQWNLGEFGSGDFCIYYAWDQAVEDIYGGGVYRNGYYVDSPIDEQRYSIAFKHQWEVSERDTVRLAASYVSDYGFYDDYQRRLILAWRGPYFGSQSSGVFWEHLENHFSFGAEVSGRLNDFYEMTDRLPEIYFDVNPIPVFDFPVNYETGNRFGYLRRNPAEYGSGAVAFFSPGEWAKFDAFRFDTYHRLTAPFKVFDDVLSVVPRFGYHGTYWSESGRDNITGLGPAGEAGQDFRSILEGGMTFAGRGVAPIDDQWRHMVEPYLDILAQKAWYTGSGRPYVFDGIDASCGWEDQFAGRARNLPYSYYGITPGVRNAWDFAAEDGTFSQIVDLDVYAAFQFGTTDYLGLDDAHKIAEVGDPNYGKDGCFVMPGARLRWNPSKDISLWGRAEYDSDNKKIAFADVGFRQVVTEHFKYDAVYAFRDYRWWDFSSYADSSLEEYNFVKAHFVQLSCEHQVIDWFAWGPFVRWDVHESELDRIGAWFDYLTDCLGFRFIVEYDNAYLRPDGYEHESEWSVGFYIYLRAFGADSSNFFSGSSY